MKYLLIALSVVCLSFTFSKDYFDQKGNEPDPVPEAAAMAPDQTTPATPIDGGKAGSVSSVVTAALAFKASLTATQQASLQLTYSSSLARKWSNLPCGSGCRNGIQIGTLTSAQLQLALAMIKEATGTVADDGYSEFLQIRYAEAALKAAGGNGYDTGLYFIAFLNTPSTTGSWMLQFGGHHYAANIAFNGGRVIGATPRFEGVEPTSFTLNGNTYTPLNGEHDAMAAMLASLTTAQLTTAKITSQTFSDVTLAPGETNGGSGTFPATKIGVACSTLTTAQQALVIAAMQHWVQDMDDVTAAAIMATYTSELAGTYISYAGNGTSGNASSFLSANTNYARIDGPTVWIEFVCQSGVVFPSQIHYHTVWRDHSHDYGVDLTGAAIDNLSSSGTTSVAATSKYNTLTVYPNPAGDYINVAIPERLKAATVIVVNAANGQAVRLLNNYSGAGVGMDVSQLPAGAYILRIADGATIYAGRFTKL